MYRKLAAAAAIALATISTAKASIWEIALTAYANTTAGLGLQTVRYTYDTAALTVVPNCAVWCEYTVSGPLLTGSYEGVVNGTIATPGILHVHSGRFDDPTWRVGDTFGVVYAPVGADVRALFFLDPVEFSIGFNRIAQFFHPIESGSVAGSFSWISDGDLRLLNNPHGSVTMRPMPASEPAILALLVFGTVALWRTVRRENG